MKRTIEQMEFEGKRVLVRVDFNVPLDENGNITDSKRIVEAMPTIKYILAKGGRVILISHLGRPDGKPNPKYSLLPVAKALMSLFACKVIFSKDVVGKEAFARTKELKNGEILLLENVRFHAEEELNDPAFAKQLAALGEVFVNDAFGTAHRKHASTYGLAKLLPSGLGLLMGKETNMLEKAMSNPERPFVAVLGGAKITDKIQVVRNLLPKVDTLIIGGGMAYTFVAASGGKVGGSLVDNDSLAFAKEMLDKAEKMGVKILLPVDSLTASEFITTAKATVRNTNNIPANELGLDIGPKAARLFAKTLRQAKTVIWNGPMGVFEFDNFNAGTKKVAQAISKVKGLTIVGGGDTAAAVLMLGLDKKMSHVSTGGGASLKLLEGLELPCISVIENLKA